MMPDQAMPMSMSKIIVLLLIVVFSVWTYQAITPPSPSICGSSAGPAITAPRIKLRDGRYMAYKEHGVPRQTAKFKIIYVHGFDNCRHQAYVATRLSPELYEELGLYIVSFDRPGYGESDPHPKRNMKSMALDVEELADQLDLGSKFYVIGYSIAGQYVYSCLEYIPHRLAGVSLVSPAVNYWWPNLASNLTNQVYKSHVMLQDKFTLGVAHHLPWLAYWWNTQKWFPSFSVATLDMTVVLSPSDLQILSTIPFTSDYMVQLAPVRQQGEYESIHRDLMVGFGKWEVDPMDIKNPFPNKEGSVHLWHGDDDSIVSVILQRYVAEQIPWIRYHEVRNTGHILQVKEGMADRIVKTLLLGEEN